MEANRHRKLPVKASDNDIEKEIERRILSVKFKKLPPPRRNIHSSVNVQIEDSAQKPLPVGNLSTPSTSTLCHPSPVLSETRESDVSSQEFNFDLEQEDENSNQPEPVVEVFRYDIENGQFSKMSEESEDSGFQGSPAVSDPKKITSYSDVKTLTKGNESKMTMSGESRMSKMSGMKLKRCPSYEFGDEPLLPGDVDCSDLVKNPVFSSIELFNILNAHVPEEVNAYADELHNSSVDNHANNKKREEPTFAYIEIQEILSRLHQTVPSSGRLKFLPDQKERSPSPIFWTPERIPERVPERAPERISVRIPVRIPERVPERAPERISVRIPVRAPERVPVRIPVRVPERVPERAPGQISERIPVRIPERVPERVPVRAPERIPERIPEPVVVKKTPLTQVDLPGTSNANKPTQIVKISQHKGKRSWPFPSESQPPSLTHPSLASPQELIPGSSISPKIRIVKQAVADRPTTSSNLPQVQPFDDDDDVEIIEVKPLRPATLLRQQPFEPTAATLLLSQNDYKPSINKPQPTKLQPPKLQATKQQILDLNNCLLGRDEYDLVGQLVGMIGLGKIDTGQPNWFTKLIHEVIKCEKQLDSLLKGQDEEVVDLQQQNKSFRAENLQLARSIQRIKARAPTNRPHKIVTQPTQYHRMTATQKTFLRSKQ